MCRLRNAKPYPAEPFGQISKALAEHFAPPVAVVEADEPNAFAIKPPCPPIAFAEVLPHIYKSTTDDERATIWTAGKDGWHGAALAVVMPHTVCWRGSRSSALAALEGARR